LKEYSGSWVLALPFKVRLPMVMVMIFFLSVGSFLKFVIYKVHRGEKGRPINILIWVDQVKLYIEEKINYPKYEILFVNSSDKLKYC
jgi:hypothetical protein